MTPAQRLIERLDGVRARGDGKWMACCPAHPDKSPSLSIRETDIGTVLLHCFAGCATDDVLGAVGLEFSDLYPDPLPGLQQRAELRFSGARPEDAIMAWSYDTTVLLAGVSDWLAGKTLERDDVVAMQRALIDMRALIDEARHVVSR